MLIFKLDPTENVALSVGPTGFLPDCGVEETETILP